MNLHTTIFCFSPFADTVAQNRGLDRKNFETALLGKRAQFQCSVQSPNAAEVEIWWEFEGKNITQDGEHYEVLCLITFGPYLFDLIYQGLKIVVSLERNIKGPFNYYVILKRDVVSVIQVSPNVTLAESERRLSDGPKTYGVLF